MAPLSADFQLGFNRTLDGLRVCSMEAQIIANFGCEIVGQGWPRAGGPLVEGARRLDTKSTAQRNKPWARRAAWNLAGGVAAGGGQRGLQLYYVVLSTVLWQGERHPQAPVAPPFGGAARRPHAVARRLKGACGISKGRCAPAPAFGGQRAEARGGCSARPSCFAGRLQRPQEALRTRLPPSAGDGATMAATKAAARTAAIVVRSGHSGSDEREAAAAAAAAARRSGEARRRRQGRQRRERQRRGRRWCERRRGEPARAARSRSGGVATTKLAL